MRLALMLAAAVALGAGAASARTWTIGSGATHTDAVHATNEAARVKAKADGTCYHPVEEGWCRKGGTGWSCIAEVTSYRIEPGSICLSSNGIPRAGFAPVADISPWVKARMAGVKGAE